MLCSAPADVDCNSSSVAERNVTRAGTAPLSSTQSTLSCGAPKSTSVRHKQQEMSQLQHVCTHLFIANVQDNCASLAGSLHKKRSRTNGWGWRSGDQLNCASPLSHPIGQWRCDEGAEVACIVVVKRCHRSAVSHNTPCPGNQGRQCCLTLSVDFLS